MIVLWASVWPNLLASALWGVPALYVHYRRLRAHHRRLIDELRQDLSGAASADPSLPTLVLTKIGQDDAIEFVKRFTAVEPGVYWMDSSGRAEKVSDDPEADWPGRRR